MPPLQHQAEGGGLASQFGQRLSVDASNAKSFQESCSSTSADSCRSFPQASGSTPQFPGKGLIEPSSATSVCVQASRPTSHGSANGDSKAENFMKSSSRVIFSDSCQTPIVGGGGSSSGGGNTSSPSMGSSTLMAPVNRQQKQSAPHKIHPIGYTEQRGSGVSQKFGSGSDWHRRAGFQGRNQNLWAEKNFPSSKMKQIYVPKPATRVPTTTVWVWTTEGWARTVWRLFGVESSLAYGEGVCMLGGLLSAVISLFWGWRVALQVIFSIPPEMREMGCGF